MISIRVAEQADLPALLQIYNEEVLHGTATFDLHPKTLAERQVWFDQHNQDNHPLLTAELDGTIAGYASLSAYAEKEAYCSTVELSVYVAKICPEKRRCQCLDAGNFSDSTNRCPNTFCGFHYYGRKCSQ